MAQKVLQKAKQAKKDEFYTQLKDIEDELRHYKAQFKNKVVYCNCDDPFESNFFKYFVLNFKHLELKSLITTSYKPSPIDETQLALSGIAEPIVVSSSKGRPKTKAKRFIINDVGDIDGDGAFNLKDVAEQLKANKNNEWASLEGDGDFRSPECVELLKQSDIVVTNPPFSLFREYIAQLMQYKKKFLVIGPNNAVHYKEIFPYIKKNNLWLGYNNGSKKYLVADDHEEKKLIIIDGQKFMPMGNTYWYTNLDIAKRHQKLILYKKYNSEYYPSYNNYDGIEVEKVAEIPVDYSGNMGVPDNFLDKYNPSQFEIIGVPFGNLGKEIGVSKNYRGRTDISYVKDGEFKCPFSRIIIKVRQDG